MFRNNNSVKVQPENHHSVLLSEVCVFLSFAAPWKLILVFNLCLLKHMFQRYSQSLCKNKEVEDQLLLTVLQWLTLSSKVGPYIQLDISRFGNPGSQFCTDFVWELKHLLMCNTSCENNCNAIISLSIFLLINET